MNRQDSGSAVAILLSSRPSLLRQSKKEKSDSCFAGSVTLAYVRVTACTYPTGVSSGVRSNKPAAHADPGMPLWDDCFVKMYSKCNFIAS